MNTREIIQDAIANGGGTYSLNDGEWDHLHQKTGYVVAEANGIENWPLGLRADIINGLIMQWNLADSGYYLGLWFDENGNWSIDKVSHFDSLYWAKGKAMWNKQRAIWDQAEGKEIRIDA